MDDSREHDGVESVAAETRLIFGPLFERAKATDEFEYACTLLRVRGIQSPGWDPVFESMTLIREVIALTRTPLQPAARLRLGLLLYLHTTEMAMPYHVIANLLRVTLGERYSLTPFTSAKAKYPAEKIDRIKAWAEQASFPHIGPFFDSFFSSTVRNAFAHSDYVLHGESFNITAGKGVVVDGIVTPSVPIRTVLVPKLERAINFTLTFLDL